MKKLILSIAVLAFSVSAFAQGQPMGFGIKAGVNFPKYNFSGNNSSYQTNTATNFHVTAFFDAPISTNWFSIQPGVCLQGRGAELSSNEFGTLRPNTMWIEVPVNFVAKFPVQQAGHFFLGAGPYVVFGISGKNKYDSDWGSTEQEFEFDKDGTIKGT